MKSWRKETSTIGTSLFLLSDEKYLNFLHLFGLAFKYLYNSLKSINSAYRALID